MSRSQIDFKFYKNSVFGKCIGIHLKHIANFLSCCFLYSGGNFWHRIVAENVILKCVLRIERRNIENGFYSICRIFWILQGSVGNFYWAIYLLIVGCFFHHSHFYTSKKSFTIVVFNSGRNSSKPNISISCLYNFYRKNFFSS